MKSKPVSVKLGTYEQDVRRGRRARADRSEQVQAKRVAVSPVHRRKPGYQSRLRRPNTNTATKVVGSLIEGTIESKLASMRKPTGPVSVYAR